MSSEFAMSGMNSVLFILRSFLIFKHFTLQELRFLQLSILLQAVLKHYCLVFG